MTTKGLTQGRFMVKKNSLTNSDYDVTGHQPGRVTTNYYYPPGRNPGQEAIKKNFFTAARGFKVVTGSTLKDTWPGSTFTRVGLKIVYRV